MVRGFPKRVLLIVAVGILGLVVEGCGRPAGAPAATAGDGFVAVVDRLRAEAQGKSVNGTAITVTPAPEGPDGRRVVTARRVRGDTTTDYTFGFRQVSGGWVCCEATAEETGPGNERIAHRLQGAATELDQLILWLGW